MNSKKINQKISKQQLANVILGIRRKFNLSIPEMAYKLHLSRDSVRRYEKMRQNPKINTLNLILDFIDKQEVDIKQLELLGSQCENSFTKDTNLPKLKIKNSEALAELIGIILGDGEVTKEGIRISFDPKKDKNYLYRRVFPLIKSLLDFDISFESYKRIVFYNISFVRYLEEDCEIKRGSKFRNNSSIPPWCKENSDYYKAALRGLFDTDGYFGYVNGSAEVMFGRFSDKCTNLVNDIDYGLKSIGFNPKTKHTKDGRYRIRLTSKKEILRFFSVIGTSNLKHISRFLLWRIAGYEAKIEKEGLKQLIYFTNKLIDSKIEGVQLPYFWSSQHDTQWKDYIENDSYFVKTHIIKTKAFPK